MKEKLRAIALCEAIISPDWESRYYSYNAHWGEDEELASMRNGSGGKWFLWIKRDLMAFNCIDDVPSLDNISEVLAQFPADSSGFIAEPAFTLPESCFLMYFQNGNWTKFGTATELVKSAQAVFEWQPVDYVTWAQEYYGRDIDLYAVKDIFNGKITEEIVRKLNPDIGLQELKTDLQEIGIIKL